MSSLFANKLKTNICFVSVILLVVLTILCATVQTCATIITRITIRSLFLSAYNLFASHCCSLFFSHDYSLFCSQPLCKQYAMAIFKHATSHKADWIITTDPRLFCLALLYTQPFTLQNVLKVESSGSRFLENSIVTACICT